MFLSEGKVISDTDKCQDSNTFWREADSGGQEGQSRVQVDREGLSEKAAPMGRFKRRAFWEKGPASAKALGRGHPSCVSGTKREAGDWSRVRGKQTKTRPRGETTIGRLTGQVGSPRGPWCTVLEAVEYVTRTSGL